MGSHDNCKKVPMSLANNPYIHILLNREKNCQKVPMNLSYLSIFLYMTIK